MDLMRNSNFERGNDVFWTQEGFTSFNVTNANPAVGTYSAVLVTSAGFEHILHNSDLLPANSGDKVRVGCYVSGLMDEYFQLGFRTYDKDGIYIGSVYGSRYKGIGSYQYQHEELEVPVWASYIAFCLRIYTPGNGKTIYADLCSLQINSEAVSYYRDIALMSETGIDADGDSKDFTKYLTGYDTYYAVLDFDAKAGHTADCTVNVVERNEIGGYLTIGTFTVTAVDAKEKIVLTNCVGRMLAVEYTFGAGVKNCDIDVNVIGKR